MVYWLLFQSSLLCFAHHCLLIVTRLCSEVLLAHKLKTTLSEGEVGAGGPRLHMGMGFGQGIQDFTRLSLRVRVPHSHSGVPGIKPCAVRHSSWLLFSFSASCCTYSSICFRSWLCFGFLYLTLCWDGGAGGSETSEDFA